MFLLLDLRQISALLVGMLVVTQLCSRKKFDFFDLTTSEPHRPRFRTLRTGQGHAGISSTACGAHTVPPQILDQPLDQVPWI